MHYFLHFSIHGNAFTVTRNALIILLLGGFVSQTTQGAVPPAPLLGA